MERPEHSNRTFSFSADDSKHLAPDVPTTGRRPIIAKPSLCWNFSPKQSTAIIHSVLLCLLIGASGCTMFRSNSDPAPIETGTMDEPLPVDEETSAATNEVQAASEKIETVAPLRFEAIGIAFLEPPQPDSERKDDEAKEFIEATGYGFPSPTATNTIQKRVTATEAAQYRAMAKLAEKHLGVEVSREATTLNMAFDQEEVVVTLSGSLKGISEVARSYDEKAEMATVSLKMALETEQKPVPRQKQLTIEQRKARAEAAAHIHATALLREKIGKVYVEQEIRIEDLEMSHQEARTHVEGLLEGVRFSEIRWTSASICEVTATLEVQGPQEESKENTPDTPPQSADTEPAHKDEV